MAGDVSANKAKKVILYFRLSYFFYYLSVGCLHTFYPIILRKAGLNNSQIGILSTVGLVGGCISPLLVSFVADKLKKSRLILILLSSMTFMFHIAPIVFISMSKFVHDQEQLKIANVTNITLLYDKSIKYNQFTISKNLFFCLCILQFLLTFGDQACKPLMDGICHKTIDICKKAGVVVDFGRIRMLGGVGMAFSSLLSGFLLEHIKRALPPIFPEEACLALLSFIGGTCYVAILIIVLPDAEAGGRPDLVATVKEMFAYVDVIAAVMLQFMIYFAFSLTKTYESLYILFLGGSKVTSAVAAFIVYISDVLMMYMSPLLSEVMGRMEYTIAATLFLSSIRSFLYSYSDSPLLSYNNAILVGLCAGIQVPCISKLFKLKAPPELVNSFSSLSVTAGKLGAAIANPIGGSLSDLFGYKVIFISASILFAVTGALLLLFIRYEKNIPPRLLSKNARRIQSVSSDEDKPILRCEET